MFKLFIFAILYCSAVALNVKYQVCLREVSKRNPTISVSEQEWLCENADSVFHKKKKHEEFKAAGYTDINLFNRFYAWNASSTFQAYFQSQAYKEYNLELQIRQEMSDHHKDYAWLFIEKWKGDNTWRSLGSNPSDNNTVMAHDVYNSWDKSEYSLKAEKWKKMIEIARTNYPPFHEEWSFGQYFLKEKGWDYELRDNEMKHIVDEWRNSLDYKAFYKRKQIAHFMLPHGYKGSAYIRFCEKLDKLEDKPWNDFVISCINAPEFVDVDTKEKMKSEVKRLGFKDRDEFEEFWIWTETQSTSTTSKPTVVPLLQADPKVIRTDADIQTAVDDWCNDRSAALNKYGHISEWDTSSVTSMLALFQDKKDFNDDISNWDVRRVRSMDAMFLRASSFNQSLDSWDVRRVTNMHAMFASCTSFNRPLASWDVSKVTNMYAMFYKASSFNQPLKSWDVSKVIDMQEMFMEASSFNQPLDSWDVSKVTTMADTFNRASSFNQPLNSWNVGKVISTMNMFHVALSFNHPLNSWDVSKVTNMHGMFWEASSFNQPLDSWDVSKVTDMRYIFKDASTLYQCLNSWSSRISGSCVDCQHWVVQFAPNC